MVTQAAPNLLNHCAVAEDSAANLLITAGDNPDRLHTEAVLIPSMVGVAFTMLYYDVRFDGVVLSPAPIA